VGDRQGRASSAIVEFDPDTLTGVTESGRVYQLRGRPSMEGDGQHVCPSARASRSLRDPNDFKS
jgi:hypothetical protein